MAITYTEIKEEKNTRIWIFYTVVIIFYFLVAVIISSVVKAFIMPGISDSGSLDKTPYLSFLTIKELLGVLLFALVAAAGHVAYSISNAVSFVEKNLDAQTIDPTDSYHSRFLSIVDELNVATGSKYNITPVVIPTTAMNAFAICNNKKEAMIGVTEGLLSKLTRPQLEAVVAHEVGHIVSGDSFQTTLACSLFGIYAAILTGIRKMFGRGRSMRGNGAAMILLIYLILSLTQFFYNIIRLFVSRDRELRADAIAVQLSRDPVSLSEALYAVSRGWRGLGYIEPTLESLFIINPLKQDIDEEEGLLADLFSTHPPIKRRMAILAAMAHGKVDDIKAGVLAQEKARELAREMPQTSGVSGLPKDEALLTEMLNAKLGGREKSVFKCPKCSHFLAIEDYEGLRVYHCLFCDGYLVEENKLPRVMIRKEKGFDGRIEKLAGLTQKDGLVKLGLRADQSVTSPFKCPKCGNELVRGFYTLAYLAEVDRCLSCNATWFDKDSVK